MILLLLLAEAGEVLGHLWQPDFPLEAEAVEGVHAPQLPLTHHWLELLKL